jgi:NAD(P)-dependent dehydrogenase (short-subunit alcohol dehydrogenase family)
MGRELAGKVAVVTGGASGLGRAMAELFVAEGARVVVADLATGPGEELAATLGESAAFQRTDVSDAGEVQALVDFTVGHFGGLDVMVNNAGVPSSFARILKNDFADFDSVIGVNLYGVMVGTQRAARHMAEHGGGSIINTSSIAALSGGAGPIVYRVSKAAVLQFTRSSAVDLADYGIRVNALAPGHIATGITNYDMGPVIKLTQPLQRHGSPDDVANAALYLASDRSAQVTGIVIPVDGGTTAGPPVSQLRDLMGIAKGEKDGR